MSTASSRLRKWFLWVIGPVFILLLVAVVGFLYWIVATPAGTRFVLHAGVHSQKGSIEEVHGSFWHGVSIGRLDLPLAEDMSVGARDFSLQVDWQQLWRKRVLQVNTLSAGYLKLVLPASKDESQTDDEPFEMPALPIGIELSHVSLGALDVTLGGEPLPMTVADFSAQAALVEQLDLQLHSLQVGYEEIQLDIQAKASLQQLSAPWPAELDAHIEVFSHERESPICAEQYLPTQMKTTAPAQEPSAGLEAGCDLTLELKFAGSFEQGQVTVQGEGQGFALDGQAEVALEAALPVNHAVLDARLPDQSRLQFSLDWLPSSLNAEQVHVFSSLRAHEFNLGAWLELAELDVPSVLDMNFDANITVAPEKQILHQASTTLVLHEGTVWNEQPAQGQVAFDLALKPDSATAQGQAGEQPFWLDYVLTYANTDLHLGANHLALSGRWAQSPEDTLDLQLDGPSLHTLWPGLESIGATEVDMQLSGDWQQHRLAAKAGYLLSPLVDQAIEPSEDRIEEAVAQRSTHPKLGTGWVRAEVGLRGSLDLLSEAEGLPFDRWRADINHLRVAHAAFALQGQNTARVEIDFEQPDRPLAVDVGAWTLLTQVEDIPWLTLVHDHSHWQGTQWSTKGHTEPVRFSARFVDVLMRNAGLQERQQQRGGIIFTDERIEPLADIELQLAWDLAFKEALGGQISLRRVAGDIMVPDEPPVPLGLEQAQLVVGLTPQGAGQTRVQAQLDLHTRMMGFLQANLETPFYFSPEQGFEIRESDLKTININAQMDDLSWTQLIIGDAMELRGQLDAQVEIRMRELDDMQMQGDIRGRELRVTRLDDGVRLLDGKLDARLDGQRFVIDTLYFPALLRVEPKEWRTATWITEEEDAKNGFLEVTGFWDLEGESGHFEVELYRYPILQRADRYAMMTGKIDVEALLPQINIMGKLVADAGWFDLDMLGGIPSIDGDVVVIRAGDVINEEEAPTNLDMSMDLEIDLGPRFYLTGYGVNSGLVGQLRVMMVGDELTGLGALRTRGGAIEIYGQRLQLRRGTITFQGDITNPILNIEALRTGLAVEAGVRVAGTAHHPKIDLVSYPDVDELEKLSWLLFGHGPDESGGDVALLISVGTSMLSDGEPFYKRFGIDELSLQSGDIGGAGSILPPTSTASSLESEVSEVEKRFIQASKVFGQGFTVGVRQALSDSGTVGRATYRLSRRLTAEISLGTVSGMALLYRWFSRDD